MTPKEKAWNMFWNYKNIPDKWNDEKVFQNYYAKQCALIAVDEILEELFEIALVTGSSYVHKHIDYYQEVKQEIDRL